MNAQKFEDAIRLRGFKPTGTLQIAPENGPKFKRNIGGGGCWFAVVGTKRGAIDGSRGNSFSLSYEFITEELIDACCGGRK